MAGSIVHSEVQESENNIKNQSVPFLSVKQAVNLLAITVTIFITLVLTPLATTTVEIDVTSPGNSESVMYFGPSAAEKNIALSASQALQPGQQTLKFPFNYANSNFSSRALWIPCSGPAEIEVGSIQLVSPLLTSSVPSTNVSLIRCDGGAYSIPLTLDLLNFSIRNYLLLIATSCLLAFSLFGIFKIFRKNRARCSVSKTESAWRRNSRPSRDPVELGPRVKMPPVWVTAIALGVVVWNIFLTFWGALRSGISWDEPNHVFMLQGWLDTGIYAEKIFADEPLVVVFGPVGDLIGHLFAVALGAEGLTPFL